MDAIFYVDHHALHQLFGGIWKRLALPHFAKEEVPEEPKEITDFFKNFAKTSEADKIA